MGNSGLYPGKSHLSPTFFYGGVSRNGISSLLKSDARKDMGVRVPPPPFYFIHYVEHG